MASAARLESDSQSLSSVTRCNSGIERAQVKIDDADLLRRGQFSTIYKSKRFDEHVAVKCVIGDHEQDHLDRVVTEAQILSSLQHHNVLRFYGIGVDAERGLVYIVFELLSVSLRERYDRAPYLTLIEQRNIALAVAAGLKYLHGRHIVHRNLTASNVVLTDCGGCACAKAKIGGFGAARRLDTMKITQYSQENFDCRNIEAHYRPPGTGNQAAFHKSSDRYQYGLLIMAMCLRQGPTSALQQDRWSDLARLDALESPFCGLVEQCLQEDPIERPPLSCVLIQLKRIPVAASTAGDELSKETEGTTTWDGAQPTPYEAEGDAVSAKDRVKFREQLMGMLQKVDEWTQRQEEGEATSGRVNLSTSVADTGSSAAGTAHPTMPLTYRPPVGLSTKLSNIYERQDLAKGIEEILDNKNCADLAHELAKKRKNCEADNYVSLFKNSMERHDRNPFNLTNVYGLLSFFLDEDDCTCGELLEMIELAAGPGKSSDVKDLIMSPRFVQKRAAPTTFK